MRNAHLKTVRNLWKEYVFFCRGWTLLFNVNLISTARIFLGRGAVMAKALGSTIEEEHREGLHKLAEVGPLD
jgi:mRNA turnover protein 4